MSADSQTSTCGYFALETSEARHQPLGGERGRGGDGQAAALDLGGEQGGGLGEVVESVAQSGEGGLGGVGEEEAARGALEERSADIVLEILDLLRHRAWRHRELVGGAAEVEVAGRGLERPQSV